MASLKVGFIPTEGGYAYREALEQVERAEALGLDSVWMEEHHGVPGHYWPSPLLVLAGFATRTSRLLLGTDILVAPFYHPVRLAEDAALLDQISGGRLVLGLAIGYKPDEFALYGAALEGRGARFEEQLQILRGLWTQERFEFAGRTYRLAGRLEPKPVSRPHPPIWIGGWGERALRRAALLADAWIPGPTADLSRLQEGRRRVLAYRAAAGLPPPAEWPLTRDVVLADTADEAWALAERHLLVAYREEYAGSFRHPFIDQAAAADLRRLAADRFLIGDPEGVVAALRPFVTEFGATHLICRLFFPGLPHRRILRALELLAREVRPAFA